MIEILKMENGGIKEVERLIKGRTDHDLTQYREQVLHIVKNVRRAGDMAVKEYTRRFDQVELCPKDMLVTVKEFAKAYLEVEEEFISALQVAQKRIRNYHEAQKVTSWNLVEDDGVIMGQVCRPLERVGVYVPGGSAVYPSSVLMTVIPANVAGVEEIVMVTPPNRDGSVNPYVLTAATIAGVDRIYKVGGAQSIAALAYGTDSIPKVDKIVGPGNIYVSLAKQLVYGQVDIDMVAGPSEILIIADGEANPRYLAADLLSQAEHDPLAAAILVTPSAELVERVQQEVEIQKVCLPRVEIINQSLKSYGRIILVDDLDSAVAVANQIAPEHLELAVKEPFVLMTRIKNAGAIFLGEFAPEPLGDYLAGPNHVLPTNGTARFFSPLSVRDYVKFSSFLSYSKGALLKVKDQVTKLAEVEGLEGHANAIKARFVDLEEGDENDSEIS